MGLHGHPRGDWHKADIKAALEKSGWTLRNLAALHGITHRALSEAFKKRYPASERRIADAIGIHPMVIWPSRYKRDGTTNARRGRRSVLAAPPIADVKKAGAF